MFDYNFSEQLTMKRQIILLLSMVIPTDPDILKDIYNIDGKHVPSAPLWTQGIDVEKVTHVDFTRDTDPEAWDNTTEQINKFRIDCAAHFFNTNEALISRDNNFAKEIEIYNSLDK